MSIFLTILLVVVGLIALPFVIALFTQRGYTIQRETTIKRAKNDVFNYVKYLRNQDNYSKWVMTDPNMKKVFSGTDGAPGFVYAWDSDDKNTGKGEQEITRIIDGEQMGTEIRFEKPFKSVAQALLTCADMGGQQTKVEWQFTSSFKYPMNMMLLFVNFDKVLGKDMESSLSRLKGILEK